jgi:acyl carrier protein
VSEPTSTLEVITEFVCQNLLDGDRSALGEPDEPLIGPLIDSVGLHELIDFLQSRFGIEIGELDIREENFQSLAAVAAYTDGKLAEE